MKIKFFFVALFAMMSLGVSAQNFLPAEDAAVILEDEVRSLESDLTANSTAGTMVSSSTTIGDVDEVRMKLRLASMVLDNLGTSKDAETAVSDARNQLNQYAQEPQYANALSALGYVESLISN